MQSNLVGIANIIQRGLTMPRISDSRITNIGTLQSTDVLPIDRVGDSGAHRTTPEDINNYIKTHSNYIYAESYTTLALADAAAVAAGKQLVISTPQMLTTYTFLADVEIVTGGNINNSGAVIFAGNFKGCNDCFIGSGAISGLKEVTPEMFGATSGRGVSAGVRTTNTTAINRAFATLVGHRGGTLYINHEYEVNGSIDFSTTTQTLNRYVIDGDGGEIYSYHTGTVLDMVGQRFTNIKNLKLWADNAETGILYGRSGEYATVPYADGAYNYLSGVDVDGSYSKATLVSIAAENLFASNCTFWNDNYLGAVYYSSMNNTNINATTAQSYSGHVAPSESTNTAIFFSQCSFFTMGDAVNNSNTVVLENWANVSFSECILVVATPTPESNIVKFIASNIVGANDQFLGKVSFNQCHFEAACVDFYFAHSGTGKTMHGFIGIRITDSWIVGIGTANVLFAYQEIAKTQLVDFVFSGNDLLPSSKTATLPNFLESQFIAPTAVLTLNPGAAYSYNKIKAATVSGIPVGAYNIGNEISDSTGWTTATLLNGWGGGVKYYRDPYGIVHLKGFVYSGVLGTVIFNLPSGYRPSGAKSAAIYANNAYGSLSISPGGDVVELAGATTDVFLDSVTFDTN